MSKDKIPAVMYLEEGEEIVGIWASPEITEIGIYKLLAKKRKDGGIEWANFVQRSNGLKDRVSKGEVKNEKELQMVVDAVNRSLKTAYGPDVQLHPGKATYRSLMGNELDDSIN